MKRLEKLKKLYAKLVEKFYDRLDRDLIASSKDFLGGHGRVVGHEPTFEVLNPTQVVIFGAGLVVGEKSWKSKLFGKRVIWFGDLNLSQDLDNLVGLSRLAGDTLYVLNRNHGDVCSVRSVGNDNVIKLDSPGVEQDLDGRYSYTAEEARTRNLAGAKAILEQSGWLPLHLLEFYGLSAPKAAKRRKAKKAWKKTARKRRAKKAA